MAVESSSRGWIDEGLRGDEQCRTMQMEVWGYWGFGLVDNDEGF